MDTSAAEVVFKNVGKKHKIKPMQFISVASGVQKRLETNVKHRKGCRLTEFDNVRDLSRNTTPVKEDEAERKYKQRRQQLEKWKQEREKKKKEQAAHKKKPFLAGVVPVPLTFVLPLPMPSTSGRVTRLQAARVAINQEKPKVQATRAATQPEKPNVQSFAPKNASFRPPQLKKTTLTTSPSAKVMRNTKQAFTFDPVLPVRQQIKNATNTRLKTVITEQVAEEPIRRMNTRSRVAATNANINIVKNKITKSPKKIRKITDKFASMRIVKSQSKINTTQSIMGQNSSEEIRELDHDIQISTNTNVTIPNSESRSEEKLRSPKDAAVDVTLQMTVAESNISPFVTLSRGKDNARREMKKKILEGLFPEDAFDTDSVQYFRDTLQTEIARITRHCEEWDAIYEDIEMPEFVQEQVLITLGQARLLMTQKMQQFASLIDRCETHDAGPRVTNCDLQGFWDMLSIQIVSLDVQFKKLEELRRRDWAEEAPAPPQRAARRRPGARASKRTSNAAPASSRLKELIAAARKAKMSQSEASSGNSSSSAGAVTPAGDCKTFEAGFFSVRSPVRSTPATTATPRDRGSLLRNVLSSEAMKASASKQSASFAMLHASILSKNIDIEGIGPLEQTPKLPSMDATPARSILKSSNKGSTRRRSKKSIKTVLFYQSDDEPAKESEANIDINLSSVDAEQEPDKENIRAKQVRQNAILVISPLKTRSARKSMNTPKEDTPKSPKRSTRRKKALQESEGNVLETDEEVEVRKRRDTPRRSCRSKADDKIDLSTPDSSGKTRRRRVRASDA